MDHCIIFLYRLIKKGSSSILVILIAFQLLSLSSCSSIKNISIQVAVKPEYPISDDIQSLAILNRSMTSRFSDLKADSLEKILIANKMMMDSVFRDSIASDTAIQVAAQALFESGRFDVVIPEARNIIRTDTNSIVNPLDTAFINEICRDFKVDAVLILENFAERLETIYTLKNGVSNENGEYSAVTDVSFVSDWRLYRRDNFKPVKRFQVSDIIFWKHYSYSLEDLYSQMPRIKEALVGGGIEAGLKLTNYISPKWVNQTRYYFVTGKDEIDAAIPLIKNNKWEEAAAIWMKYSTTDSKAVRSKVEYNLALAAEMTGKIDLAIEWGLKSFKTRYSKAAEAYLIKLDTLLKAELKETKKSY